MSEAGSGQSERSDGPAASRGIGAEAASQALLECATELSGVVSLPRVADAVGRRLASVPGLRIAALLVIEKERELLRIFWRDASAPDSGRSAARETWPPEEALPLDDSIAPLIAVGAGAHWLETGCMPATPVFARLGTGGVARLLGAGLHIADQPVGWLLAGFSSPVAASDERVRFIDSLARLVAPIAWNCLTQARFERGDRRRDTLLYLSREINTSLRLESVLASAQRVLERLDAHPCSAILLLDTDRSTYLAIPDHRVEAASDAPSQQRRPATGSLLSMVLAKRVMHQSADLRDTAACDEDRELASRGVRRYVAAPLIVRGEVLGALLIASADPSPPLKIDVWMYENMAQQLALAIDNATQHEQVQRLSERLAQQNVYLREEIQSLHNVGEIAGDSPAIQRLYRDIQRVAPTTSTVLISGETGVGKELAARAIHAASPRAAQPMVKINCAAIPEGMFESELFGHERGAFTSAVERRIGRFELANGATLFLDEVGELPPAVQAKLLRVLQDGEFERVGGTRTLRTDVRIIAATNRDLLKSVAAGAFRSDLYYRLNVFPVHVPPLRERRSDIPALVQAFIGQFNRQMGKHVEAIDRASLDELCRGDWPGNVRELRHVIERAMIFCDGTTLHVDLPPAPAAGARSGSADTEHAPARLADVEADHIRRVLAQTRGVIEGPHGAAATLGLKPSTLRFRMKQLGIRRRP